MGIADIDLAYTAGLIDGEGSIGASTSKRSPRNFRVEVSVAMCDESPIKFLADTFGGNMRTVKKRTSSGKVVYRWNLYCRKAADFLILIEPYLRVKKGRARDAIALQAMMRTPAERNSAIIDDEEVALRTEIAMRIKAANFSSNARVAQHAVG